MKQLVQLTLIALLIGTAGIAFAQRGGRHGPPPEAFEACEDLEADATCTVETPHGTLEGTCGRRRASEELHCIPDNPPPHGGHHGPPPEAFEACEDLEADATCTVETPHGTLEGTCGRRRSAEELHCIPDNPPPRPRRGR